MGKANAGLFGRFSGVTGRFEFSNVRTKKGREQSLQMRPGENMQQSEESIAEQGKLSFVSSSLNEINDPFWEDKFAHVDIQKNGWNALVASVLPAGIDDERVGEPPNFPLGPEPGPQNVVFDQDPADGLVEWTYDLGTQFDNFVSVKVTEFFITADVSGDGFKEGLIQNTVTSSGSRFGAISTSQPSGTPILIGMFSQVEETSGTVPEKMSVLKFFKQPVG